MGFYSSFTQSAAKWKTAGEGRVGGGGGEMNHNLGSPVVDFMSHPFLHH